VGVHEVALCSIVEVGGKCRVKGVLKNLMSCEFVVLWNYESEKNEMKE
jgi:hypothetical protein